MPLPKNLTPPTPFHFLVRDPPSVTDRGWLNARFRAGAGAGGAAPGRRLFVAGQGERASLRQSSARAALRVESIPRAASVAVPPSRGTSHGYTRLPNLQGTKRSSLRGPWPSLQFKFELKRHFCLPGRVANAPSNLRRSLLPLPIGEWSPGEPQRTTARPGRSA